MFGHASDFLKEKCCTTLWCTGRKQSMLLRSTRASFLPIFDCFFLSHTRTMTVVTLHPRFAFRRCIWDGDRGCFSWEPLTAPSIWFFGSIAGLSLHGDYGLLWSVLQANTHGSVEVCRVSVGVQKATDQGTLGPLVPSPSSSGASRLPCVRLSDAPPVLASIPKWFRCYILLKYIVHMHMQWYNVFCIVLQCLNTHIFSCLRLKAGKSKYLLVDDGRGYFSSYVSGRWCSLNLLFPI